LIFIIEKGYLTSQKKAYKMSIFNSSITSEFITMQITFYN